MNLKPPSTALTAVDIWFSPLDSELPGPLSLVPVTFQGLKILAERMNMGE